jgi:predicted PurR-regulated permease PerM
VELTDGTTHALSALFVEPVLHACYHSFAFSQFTQELPMSETHGSSDWITSGGFRTVALAAVTVGGLYLCALLVWPFIAPLAWALALAVLSAPFHRLLLKRLKRPNLVAAISVLLIGAIVIIPLTIVGQRLVAEAAKGAGTVQESLRSGSWRAPIDASPRLAPVAQWIQDHVDLADAASTVTSWVTSSSATVVRGSFTQIVNVLLTFYILFFFLRDRAAILETLRTYSPLSDTEMEQISTRVADTLTATLYGKVAVAAIQGALGGLMFWLLGLPSPLMWGVVMGMLSIVPVLGAFIIWVPAAIYLTVEGNWQYGAILAAWGAVVVSNVDNVLYPILVGQRLQLHNVASFIAVVGGIVAFGLSGIILGPLAVTLTLSLLEIWRARVRANAT